MPSLKIALRRWASEPFSFGRAAFDMIMPPRCPSCDELVGAPRLFCAACFSRVGLITEPCCVVCGVMFAFAAQGGSERLCPACRTAPPAFSRARAAFRYDAYTRRLILPFKHADRTEASGFLASHMARAGVALLRTADVLVPIPLHRRRLFERRYNQAALLVRSLAKATGVAQLPDGMVRLRATPPLGDMTATERHAALSDAFMVRPCRMRQIVDRSVLLIDDVMTSGATANACARVLIKAGASDVSVLVAARVPDPRLS